MQLQRTFRGKAVQELPCLNRGDLAQISGLAAGDPTMRLDVLEDHLLLLQRLEATHSHVGG